METTIYRNLILITMEMFDLVDIQRVKHPNVNKYSYVSKALNVKSRIDFFLIANKKQIGVKVESLPSNNS